MSNFCDGLFASHELYLQLSSSFDFCAFTPLSVEMRWFVCVFFCLRWLSLTNSCFLVSLSVTNSSKDYTRWRVYLSHKYENRSQRSACPETYRANTTSIVLEKAWKTVTTGSSLLSIVNQCSETDLASGIALEG